MTEIQEKLLELLEEIDEICVKNNLNYFLAEKVALSAYRSHIFETEFTDIVIYMTYIDFLKFRNEVLKNNNESRSIDSILDNETYPDMSFRYVNDETLYISLESDLGVKRNGIYIKVKILRPCYSKSIISLFCTKIEHFLEIGWISNHSAWNGKNTSKRRLFISNLTKQLIKTYPNLYLLILKKIFNYIQLKINLKDASLIKKVNGNEIIFPEGMFEEYSLVSLENCMFRMPRNQEKYLEITYGVLWRDKHINGSELSERKIIDPRLPYSYYFDYLKKCNIPRNMQLVFDNESQLKTKRTFYNKIIDDAWKKVLCTGAKFKLYEIYSCKKEEILNLHKEEEWEKLKIVFTEYDKIIKKIYVYKNNIYFDESIHIAYKDMLENTGEIDFAKKLQI